MRTSNPKLIRVMQGIYRADTGEQVFHRPWQDRDRPWVMTWTTFFSDRREMRFARLADVRRHLNEQYGTGGGQ